MIAGAFWIVLGLVWVLLIIPLALLLYAYGEDQKAHAAETPDRDPRIEGVLRDIPKQEEERDHENR